MTSRLWLVLRTSRWIRGFTFFALGAGCAAVFWGVPALSTEAAASWASAAGSFLAVATALGLGLHASDSSQRERMRRASVAATLTSPNLYNVRALVDSISENRDMVLASRYGYCAWLAKLSNSIRGYGDVIEERINPFLADIPTDELRLLVGADSAFRQFRRIFLFKDGVTHEFVFHNFDRFVNGISGMTPIVVAASDAIHKLSNVDAPPPWSEIRVLAPVPAD